jgi:hypothetical protein
MLKIVMTIVTIVASHITDRKLVEVPQGLWIEGMAPSPLICTMFANMAADAYIAKNIGATDAEIANGASDCVYDARKSGIPIMNIEYFSRNVPAKANVGVKSVGHVNLTHVINCANPSMR